MEAITQLSYALDTFYFLVSGALVMWMAAGFAMLEAGLVRAKNTAEILTKNITLFAIACIMYMLVGYGIMYPDGGNGFIPALDLGFMFGGDNSVDDVLKSNGETYYSGMSDFFFQVVFVATAMSIVSGAVAERMKLWAFLAFSVVMTGFIYPLQGYWKWGGGFLDAAGFSDFAGSGVVHLCGAAAALAGVLLLGARKGKYTADGRVNAIPGANMPMATLGTFILWLGWFGFNGGSELKLSNIEEANAVAMVFVNTNAAAAGGVIAALLTARALFGKADLTMTLNGALAGLVAITAEPLTPTPLLATIVGAVGGVLVVFSIIFMDKLKIDDPVGAISVHGVVGMWGLLAVVLSNPDATLGAQLLGLGTIFAWTFGASFIVWLIIKLVMGIRVSEEEEYEGVDIGECGLEAYPEFTGSHGAGR
ncbi:ammonium transporter [Candidatus Endoriftia persephone]|uniref:Ammonium transporter n=3 Tax=Gammaproteobacteria TaxID=1236 RepID=G2FH81_9GAMM|nr:ammonium transporter [Candidatus Endoriftia persephone]EGV50038.1 putative ammonium transporter [endosymbiont of Riftia pachyptila (vent Ph05)]EGW53895.1 ammonium transporter [endosymbiont of Tevnia jerichonana (vent Tica)]USF87743.1 ammonium transporter [Candidatus Endoriftia persephone]